MSNGWIGVDLDGTLAYYDKWRGIEHIGAPIELMVARVKSWLAQGKDVRIFTARADDTDAGTVDMHIKNWCKKHIGQVLPVTCKKDYGMVELWDDRCIQVIKNTGRTLAEEHEAEIQALRGAP